MATRRNISPPNLPSAPLEYTQRFQDQLNNVLRLFFSSVANESNSPLPYGTFYSTATQTNPIANTANLATFNTTYEAYNTNIGGITSRIYVAETGVYNIEFSVQADKTSGASASMFLWLRKNGTDLVYTGGTAVVASSTSESIPTRNYVLTLQSGDYIELVWSSADTNMVFAASAASSPVPAIPSVIFTIVWVSGVST